MIQEFIPGGGDQLSYAALGTGDDHSRVLPRGEPGSIRVDFGRASTYVETIDRPRLPNCAAIPGRARVRRAGRDVEFQSAICVAVGSKKSLDCQRACLGLAQPLPARGGGLPLPRLQVCPLRTVAADRPQAGISWLRRAPTCRRRYESRARQPESRPVPPDAVQPARVGNVRPRRPPPGAVRIPMLVRHADQTTPSQ